MNSKWNLIIRIGCTVLLAVIVFWGAVPIFKCLISLRPWPFQNLHPFFQSDEIWCSEDGKVIFQANNGLAAKGTIFDGGSQVNVEVTTDISGYYVFVYIPAQTEDGTSVHDPALNLEEWQFYDKGEDWFVVEVVQSTYYKTGSMITFYIQNNQSK